VRLADLSAAFRIDSIWPCSGSEDLRFLLMRVAKPRMIARYY